MAKNAKKKLLKQQKWEAKKAEKKAQTKEQTKKEGERKRKEWEEKLSSCASEEERLKLIESRRELRKERMGKRAEEKEEKTQRLNFVCKGIGLLTGQHSFMRRFTLKGE
ncbi:hypothetical protein OIU77_004484 [Salix suchowensis]|uniref:Uncharacterized protein n=1 Tax=Salix suchowensis TaxID=1278906 RepID=A0ABQ9AXD6_9ROSI|nr:hypothetical protein OIU77_004484 [Salix suchowensis]KAJ6383860.1 hypothetical protein OIU78_027206 [Salix suchowensis]